MTVSNTTPAPKFFAPAAGVIHIAAVILLARDSGFTGDTWTEAQDALADAHELADEGGDTTSFLERFQPGFEGYFLSLTADSSALYAQGLHTDVGTAAEAGWAAEQAKRSDTVGASLPVAPVVQAVRKSRKLTDEEKKARAETRAANKARKVAEELTARTELLNGMKVRRGAKTPEDEAVLVEEYAKVFTVEKMPGKDAEGNRWKAASIVSAILGKEVEIRENRQGRSAASSRLAEYNLTDEQKSLCESHGIKAIPPMLFGGNPSSVAQVAARLVVTRELGEDALNSGSAEAQAAYVTAYLSDDPSKCTVYKKAEEGTPERAIWDAACDIWLPLAWERTVYKLADGTKGNFWAQVAERKAPTAPVWYAAAYTRITAVRAATAEAA